MDQDPAVWVGKESPLLDLKDGLVRTYNSWLGFAKNHIYYLSQDPESSGTVDSIRQEMKSLRGYIAEISRQVSERLVKA